MCVSVGAREYHPYQIRLFPTEHFISIFLRHGVIILENKKLSVPLVFVWVAIIYKFWGQILPLVLVKWKKNTTSLEKLRIFFFNHNFPACNEWRCLPICHFYTNPLLYYLRTYRHPVPASWHIFPYVPAWFSLSFQNFLPFPLWFTCCQFPHFPVFSSTALLDSFPSPEMVSVLSWIVNFPIIGSRAGKRKGWGM